MRLSYEELIAPPDVPISLSVGNIKQPTLREIWKKGFTLFRLYELYLRLKPKDYYTELNKKDGNLDYWNSLSDEQRNSMTVYDIVLIDDDLAMLYEEIFNFFFIERVVYKDGIYVVVDTDDYHTPFSELKISPQEIMGIIHPKNFDEVVDILQQICCIKSDDPMEEATPKFKNAKAKRLYERMLQAKKDQQKKVSEKDRHNLSLANIVSSVAARCPGLNIVNIWETTLFQLNDQFNKTQNFEMYYINAVRTSVWGDEKNLFDSSLWYKNNYDKFS